MTVTRHSTDQRTALQPAHRYAVVRGCRIRSTGCTLLVEDPMKQRSQVELSCRPDRVGVDQLRERGLHALAVRLEIDDSGALTCSALFRSDNGPMRKVVSGGVAVALCLDGRHTVVTRS